MTEESRKRSRKSKIVLRDCALDDEDDIELQVQSKSRKVIKGSRKNPPKKPSPICTKITEDNNISLLNKIRARADKYSEDTTPRFDINVEVEVETCDDENLNTNDESNADDQPTDEVLQLEPEPVTKKHPNKQKNKRNTEPIVLARDRILEETRKITEESSDIADGILEICVKNTIGFVKEEQINSWHEKQIQEALTAWQRWQEKNVHRETPLFYKCYICNESWWDLSGFRDHIYGHTELKLDIEKYTQHECNIIAFEPNNKPDEIKDIFTKGLCYRCGEDYTKHELSVRVSKKHYWNVGCMKRFPTCSELKDHVVACVACRVENNSYYCEICTLSFEKIDNLNDHMVLMHLVRSDRPMSANSSKCNLCSEVYSSNVYHSCGAVESHSECPYCFKSFSNKSLILDHINRSSESCVCEVCGLEIKWGCKKYEHLLMHSNKYKFVKMCDKCDGINVFLDDKSAELHEIKKHKRRNRKLEGCMYKILVPVSCLNPSEENPEKNPQLQSKNKEVPLPKKAKQNQQTLRVIIPNPNSVLNRVSILKRLSNRKKKGLILKPVESTLKSQGQTNQSVRTEQASETNNLKPALDVQKSLESQKNVIENATDRIKIKEEPKDFDDTSEIVIKQEPIDYDLQDELIIEENSIQSIETRIKQASEEEYEEDIIKLNINIEDLLANQESSRVFAYSIHEQNSESITESPLQMTEATEMVETTEMTKDSVLEPEIIISHEDNAKLYRCNKCSFKGRHDGYLRHVSINCPFATMGMRKYVCTKTGYFYNTIKKYLQHFLEHGFEALSCPDCSKQFYTYSKLGPHVLGHVKQNFIRIKKISHRLTTNVKPEYQCRKCMKMVVFEEFFQHWESHICETKTPVQTIVVTAPRLGDISESDIQDCIKWMQRSPKDCVYCKRKFQRVNECKRHIIEHLLTDAYAQKQVLGVLKCQICHVGFSAPEKYKQHMRNHASLPVYKCEICDKTFSDSSNFTKHKKVHNLKVIICDLCGKKFQSKVTLAKHIQQHQASTPVNCEKCNKIFYFQSAYRRHMKSNHDKVVFGYRCVICNIRFRSLKLKWDHMWEIHKERKSNADCPICLKSFRKYADVRAHAKLDHNTEVSVLSVKNATPSIDDIQKYLSLSDIKIGQAETLVVYEDMVTVD